ncbi:MAG: DUF3240 family protein [Polaromonas sp.]|uniref:DUF3240 family protein n=1 Tax=Polaromonas sp. TaxID=1869339 RepID=UPI0025E0BA1D|nr:DUF3240 family protein [Polaromonas sp.]MBI2728489.1 DUF3240 family protein [Polaromonas sp.]
MSDILITLLSPRALEERVLNALLQTDGIAFLSSTPTALHGLPGDTLTQSEQVLGHAKATEIRLVTDDSRISALLHGLQEDFAGHGLHFWTTPVLGSGEFK